MANLQVLIQLLTQGGTASAGEIRRVEQALGQMGLAGLRGAAGLGQLSALMTGPLPLGLAAAGASVAAAGFALVKLGEAAAAEEVGIARLSAALAAQGIDYANTEKAINRVIDANERKSVADDQTRESIARLTEHGLSLTDAFGAQAAAADLAAARGISMAEASELLGRAFEGQTTQLRRMGILIRQGASDTEILEAIQKRFGGQAEAFAGTAAGQWAQFTHEVSNLAEELGQVLLPAFSVVAHQATEGLRATRAAVADVKAGLPSLIALLNDAADAAGRLATGAAAPPSGKREGGGEFSIGKEEQNADQIATSKHLIELAAEEDKNRRSLADALHAETQERAAALATMKEQADAAARAQDLAEAEAEDQGRVQAKIRGDKIIADQDKAQRDADKQAADKAQREQEQAAREAEQLQKRINDELSREAEQDLRTQEDADQQAEEDRHRQKMDDLKAEDEVNQQAHQAELQRLDEQARKDRDRFQQRKDALDAEKQLNQRADQDADARAKRDDLAARRREALDDLANAHTTEARGRAAEALRKIEAEAGKQDTDEARRQRDRELEDRNKALAEQQRVSDAADRQAREQEQRQAEDDRRRFQGAETALGRQQSDQEREARARLATARTARERAAAWRDILGLGANAPLPADISAEIAAGRSGEGTASSGGAGATAAQQGRIVDRPIAALQGGQGARGGVGFTFAPVFTVTGVGLNAEQVKALLTKTWNDEVLPQLDEALARNNSETESELGAA